MSQENVEVVRKGLAAFTGPQLATNLGTPNTATEPERLYEFFARDVVWDMSTFSGWPDRSEFRGMDEFDQFFDAWTEPHDEWIFEVEEVLDAGRNRVVATFHQRAKPRGTDSWIDQRYGIVYTIEAGLIQRAQVYASAEEALEAAGLRENAISQENPPGRKARPAANLHRSNGGPRSRRVFGVAISPENVEIVRRVYEAFNRWGVHPRGERSSEIPPLLHPKVEFHTYAIAPEAGVYRGREAVIAYHERVFGQFESVRVELEELLSAGDHVVVISRQHTVPRGSEAEIMQRVVDVWTVREGLLAERKTFPTRAEALEAVGLEAGP